LLRTAVPASASIESRRLNCRDVVLVCAAGVSAYSVFNSSTMRSMACGAGSGITESIVSGMKLKLTAR